ncbi:MAG: kinase/pyrophosphorylase [Staphylococcus equorum]|nr:kinase/pyrophosphorylase [Tetragenococcus koreensis]MDN6570486.1 kinase/pyrophosphorylase [Staphylococcus equorum]MDN6735199.1 kinase/pyrophosphorylase [Tetragenococcus koreensis]MDN6748991.1 kinase/pyrophosphorylase [Staphylococcus equorum]
MSSLDIYILSDSVGETNEQFVRSVLGQFPDNNFNTKRFSYIITVDNLKSVLDQVDLVNKPLIFYTFVQEELINQINNFANEHSITALNILNEGIRAVSKLTGNNPVGEPGTIRKMDDAYFKRVKAIEFTVRYDDGQDPQGILKADLVLIGVSRTSKTPLSIYLANRNIKVCNIPLFPENPPPKELFEISPSKIIGLTNGVEFLNKIRKERLKTMGLSSRATYAETSRIIEELTYAENIMKRLGCIIINVENKAIEETASDILEYLKKIGHKYIND